MGDKAVKDAARRPEGGPAEARGLSASSVPCSIDRPAQMPDSLLKSVCSKQGLIKLIFDERPTNRTSMAQGLLRWVRRLAEAHSHPATPKMPRAPLAFPWIGASQAVGNKPNPSKEGKSPGGRPLRHEELTVLHECQTVRWKASAWSSS